MAGFDLTDFLDVFLATGAAYVTGPETFVNDAWGQKEYSFSTYCLDNPQKKMIQGGTSIKFDTKFKGGNTGENYRAGQVLNPVNGQRLSEGKANWRLTRVHMLTNDVEVLLNDADTAAAFKYGDDGVVFQQYVNMSASKQADMEVDLWDNVLEANLWRIPNYQTMEVAGGTDPQSMLVFNNEASNTLFDDTTGTNTAYSTSGNKTIEGFDPTAAATNSKWKNQQKQYDSSKFDGSATSGGGAGLIGNVIQAFESMWNALTWRSPETFATYYTDDERGQLAIDTSSRGQEIYASLLRLGQNHLIAGPQDPAYPEPRFRGIPVRRYTKLDALAAYTTGSALVTEMASTATNKGPRYYWRNAKFTYPVFHSERYFHFTKPLTSANVPDSVVVVLFCWYNMICTSLQRNGVVFPSGSVYTA